MTSSIDWATSSKLSELTGLSKRAITHMLLTGEIEYSKKGSAKTSSLLIRISSFNNYWLGKRQLIIEK
jgi:hypothetical protein